MRITLPAFIVLLKSARRHTAVPPRAYVKAQPLKAVFQPELDDARVDAGGSDISKSGAASLGHGPGELCMVKGIVKLGSELERMSFPDCRYFVQSNVPVELAGRP